MQVCQSKHIDGKRIMSEFILHVIYVGFATAFEPINMLLILCGVIGGLIFALLPGLNVAMIVILLVPITYSLRSEERRVGKSVSVRVDLGGRRIIKKKIKKTNTQI